MTRVTSFGRKRTYLQAGFSQDPPDDEPTSTTKPGVAESSEIVSEPTEPKPEGTTTEEGGDPPKKKRKRHRPKKKRPEAEGEIVATEGEKTENANGEASKRPEAPTKPKKRKKVEKRTPKISPGEKRRLARIKEKLDATTCFACRETGHAAKDCPTAKPGSTGVKGSKVVGICYRCGSTNHNLSKCRKPPNLENPLPYASCFVCSGKGHLASACPQNKDRGVYPNGGCCKICGDTSHLAKECVTRKIDGTAKMAVGTGRDAGADEDDFMVMVRNTKQVEREERTEERFKRLSEVAEYAPARLCARATTSVVPKPKKVVVF